MASRSSVRKPELSTDGPQTKLLLAIYSYFAETEREFISLRTKQGLAAARSSGKKLGGPKGRRNKVRVLDPYKQQIQEYLHLSLNLSSFHKLINPQLLKPLSYQAFKYFNQHELHSQEV